MLRAERKRRIVEYRARPEQRRVIARRKTKPGVTHRKTGCKLVRRIIRGHSCRRPWSHAIAARFAEARRGWMRNNRCRGGKASIKWRVLLARNKALTSKARKAKNFTDSLVAHPDAPWNK